MNRLGRRIAALIAANGPMTVADYMATCLFDPEDGYYTTREPFGAAGDFTTAPEISQMFGELVAIWLLEAWRAAGAPSAPVLAEIGPGRGTLMKDMARTLRRLSPDFAESARFVLVEASPRLRAVQERTLAAAGPAFEWHEDVEKLPRGPLHIVGNELFDAVPVRQYVKLGQAWRERAVGLDDAGRLVFVAGAGSLDAALLPPGANLAPQGSVVEIAPARSAIMARIAERIAGEGGAGLFLDYGYEGPAIGDTLQAVSRHRFADPLNDPGAADLTAHVDFSALAGAARAEGLEAALMTQGDFLIEMGLLERAGRLGANAGETEREAIREAVERLAGPGQMGRLFRVLGVFSRGKGAYPLLKS